MNHTHHNHCDHDVKWCRDCRAVYCARCPAIFKSNEEWLRDHRCYSPWQISYQTTERSFYGVQVADAPTYNPPLDLTPVITCQHGG